MIDISVNQTFETSSNSITIDNVKTKTKIIVVSSKIEFSIIVKIEIIVATKIEFLNNVETNAYNQTFFFEKIDKKRKRYKTISIFEIQIYFNNLYLRFFCNHLKNDSNLISRIFNNSIEMCLLINFFQSILSTK